MASRTGVRLTPEVLRELALVKPDLRTVPIDVHARNDVLQCGIGLVLEAVGSERLQRQPGQDLRIRPFPLGALALRNGRA
jgi:hypothetical protein